MCPHLKNKLSIKQISQWKVLCEHRKNPQTLYNSNLRQREDKRPAPTAERDFSENWNSIQNHSEAGVLFLHQQNIGDLLHREVVSTSARVNRLLYTHWYNYFSKQIQTPDILRLVYIWLGEKSCRKNCKLLQANNTTVIQCVFNNLTHVCVCVLNIHDITTSKRCIVNL